MLSAFSAGTNSKGTSMSKPYRLSRTDALLITDIQIDFLPGGALPVEGGDRIVPTVNRYIQRFTDSAAKVAASRDWHPKSHCSFTTQGGPWPPHCIADTHGALFSPDLKFPRQTIVISKATDPNREAYSAFDHTDLAAQLQRLGITRLFVAGIATDYCVVNTVLDARKLGFEVVVLMDASLGINVKVGDVDRAVEAMAKSGAVLAFECDFVQ
jgi:nicotinamidase/pyrazinamidase